MKFSTKSIYLGAESRRWFQMIAVGTANCVLENIFRYTIWRGRVVTRLAYSTRKLGMMHFNFLIAAGKALGEIYPVTLMNN